jgi:hypothetical protein
MTSSIWEPSEYSSASTFKPATDTRQETTEREVRVKAFIDDERKSCLELYLSLSKRAGHGRISGTAGCRVILFSLLEYFIQSVTLEERVVGDPGPKTF